MQTTPAIAVAAVAITAIAGATVAVCLGQIDGGTFAGIVGTAFGVASGAGVHAAGVKQAQP